MSDRARPVAVGVLLVAIVLLLVWWGRAISDGRLGVLRVLEEPAGSPVVLSLLDVRAIEGPDRYVLGRGTLEIPVAGPSAGLRVGQELTVGGLVATGHVVERWRQDAPGRPAKKALGVAGLILAAGVVAMGVRRSPEGLVLRG